MLFYILFMSSMMIYIAWQGTALYNRYYRQERLAVNKPDYDKIARLERELGVGQHGPSCSRGGHGCGVGCSAPDAPPADWHPEDDQEEIRSWAHPDPVRRINYRHPRRSDPPPRMPDRANPQIDKKFSRDEYREHLEQIRLKLPGL